MPAPNEETKWPLPDWGAVSWIGIILSINPGLQFSECQVDTSKGLSHVRSGYAFSR